EEIKVFIDRDSGEIRAQKGEEIIDPAELGRIAAQSAKQVMIQKIREAECNAVFDEYVAMKGDLVHGTVQRFEGGAATVTLGKSEAILPRGEQIPGETHHVGERVKAVILEVRKVGHRVKIILSRTHPDFVRRLFENEIPEIADRTIEIKALAREAGYPSKIVGWDIEIMTHDELNEGIEKAENWFGQLPNVTAELVEAFIEEGFLSYDDLTFLEPAQLAELAGLTEEQAEEIIAFAEEGSERVEEETRLAKQAEAEARSETAEEPAARPSAGPTAADLFAAEAPVAAPTKPTLESLFGPDVASKPEEETLSA